MSTFVHSALRMIPMYRVRNPNLSGSFCIQYSGTQYNVTRIGSTYEGIVWQRSTSAVAVSLLYKRCNHVRCYALNGRQRNSIPKHGWGYSTRKNRIDVSRGYNQRVNWHLLSAKDTKMKNLDIRLLAVFVPEACNIGFPSFLSEVLIL